MFVAQGGLILGPNTYFEIVTYVLAAAVIVAALLRPSPQSPARLYGGATLLFLTMLLVWTGASIGWSLVPSESWLEYNRTAAYVAAFAAAIAGLRLAPRRWEVPLLGILIASAIASAYALATKVAPGWLDPKVFYGRLRDPYGYWNAVGVTAAMGVPLCLWLGTRGSARAAVRALAYPLLGVLLTAILFAFSRGSLLAVGLALALWFACVPLRLRSLAVLAPAAAAAAIVALWAFGKPGLVDDGIRLAERETAGVQLGLALAALVVVLAAAGVLIERAAERRSLDPQTRRRVGIAVLACVAAVPVAGVIALAASTGGIGGQVSKGWDKLTNENIAPSNDPGRLIATSSARARYWREAWRIYDHHKLAGAGAGSYPLVRLRYRRNTVTVRHAHGYVVQTLADLGLVGLLLGLLAVAAWIVAALRTLGLAGGARGSPWTPERYGLAALGLVAFTFGFHSAIDWTWFVPGVAVMGLVAAGWVAARGPLGAVDVEEAGPVTAEDAPPPIDWRSRLRSPTGLAAVLVIALAGIMCWSAWQPLRADRRGNQALTLSAARQAGAARKAALEARDLNPLSVDPLFDLAAIEIAAGRQARASAALTDALKLQPANPQAWKRLGEFDLYVGRRGGAARNLLAGALFLDPRSTVVRQELLDADQLFAQQRADRGAARVERRRVARRKAQKQQAQP